jgi:lipopolysaccharide export system permease protein
LLELRLPLVLKGIRLSQQACQSKGLPLVSFEMRLLDRYLLRELLLPLGYCLSGFLIFWISFDLMKEMEAFQRNHVGFIDIVRYYLVLSPELLVIILPVALLLALLYSLTNHARYHEIVAMRAAGLSLWRISAPYLGVGVLFSVCVYGLNERLAPHSSEVAQQIKDGRRAESGGWSERRLRRQLNFKNDRDQRLWIIGAYRIDTGEMQDVQVESILVDGKRRHIIAKRAYPAAPGWTFEQVREIVFDPDNGSTVSRTPYKTLACPEFTETPTLIKSEIRVSEMSNIDAAKRAQLSIAEIRDYLRLHTHLAPEKSAQLLTQLHGRMAEPLTCLVVVLVALPFGAASGRRNVFVGVANSIFICFTYFILLKFGLALGTGGYVPAWLAAWFPNGFFGALGLWLTQRAR